MEKIGISCSEGKKQKKRPFMNLEVEKPFKKCTNQVNSVKWPLDNFNESSESPHLHGIYHLRMICVVRIH